MPRLFIVLLFFGMNLQSFSQASDLLSVRKKNGRIIKTFVAGVPIVFETTSNDYVKGLIKEIKNDSVFVTTYDIRVFSTYLGVPAVDTVATYVVPVYYKDILRVKVFKRPGFVRGKLDKLLLFGGAGYFVLNIMNGALSKEGITDKKNIRKLGISAGAFGLGFLLNKFFYVDRFSRKWHKIVYIKMK